MISVKIFEDENEHSIKIRGHAGFSKGKDIVCAAVSALYFALLSTAEKDKRVIFLKSREREGFAQLNFKGGSFSKGAFKMTKEGLLLLERNFPKNVKLIYERKK